MFHAPGMDGKKICSPSNVECDDLCTGRGGRGRKAASFSHRNLQETRSPSCSVSITSMDWSEWKQEAVRADEWSD